jgi:hypothetical protein
VAIQPPGAAGNVSVPVPLRLRPLEIGDILDETFRMYRRHFGLFAGIWVLLAIPSAAISGLALGWFSTGLAQASGEPDLSVLREVLGALAAAAVVSLAILPFTNGAIVYATSESALGRQVTAAGIATGILRRYFGLLGYWLLFAVSFAVSLMLCVLPVALWAWVFVGWSVVTPVMFIENAGLGAAMRRSWSLVQGRWWRTFLILLLMGIVWYVAGIALSSFIQLAQVLLMLVVSPFVASAIAAASGQLVSALVNPVMQIAIVLVYFDLRVRREALDLFGMALRLAAPAAPS